MIEAYPLYWPLGWPRTPAQEISKSRFDGRPDKVQKELIAEIERLGGRNLVISTNIKLRADGLPYVGRRDPYDNGVAVYFDRKGEGMCFACDRYWHIWENMRAIQKTIEALRGIERWGASDMMERAFSGFTALPAPGGSRSWRDVLQLGGSPTLDMAKVAYRTLSLQRHPDRGGSHDAMTELNRAWEEAQQALS